MTSVHGRLPLPRQLRRAARGSGPAPQAPHTPQASLVRILVLCVSLICLSCVVAACGAHATGTTAGAAAKQTATAQAQAQATMTATPVRLAASVTPSGTIAAHNVRLAITVTITNTTDAPIYVAYLACHRPIIHVELRVPGASPSSPALWQNWNWLQCFAGAGCPTKTASNTQGPAVFILREVAPKSTYTWTATGDLSQVSGLTRPGPYTLSVITGWIAPSPRYVAYCWVAADSPLLPVLHEITTSQTITLS